jgi:heme/copper-type cytochrome/quinol oxidase subunit 2
MRHVVMDKAHQVYIAIVDLAVISIIAAVLVAVIVVVVVVVVAAG